VDTFSSGKCYLYIRYCKHKILIKRFNEINIQVPVAYRMNCHSSGAYVSRRICMEAFVCVHEILSYNIKTMRHFVSIIAIQLVKQTTIHQFKKTETNVRSILCARNTTSNAKQPIKTHRPPKKGGKKADERIRLRGRPILAELRTR